MMKRLPPILFLLAALLLPALPSRAGAPAPEVFQPAAPAPPPAFTPAGQTVRVVAGPQGIAGPKGDPGPGVVGVNVKSLPLAMQLMGLAACKGDGVTDDLPALQALCDYCAANGLPILLAPGNYGVKGTLHVMRLVGGYHSGFVMRGLSQRGLSGGASDVTITELLPDQKAVVELDAEACFGNSMDGITIDGGSLSNNTKYCLWGRYQNWSQFYFTNCLVGGAHEGVALTGRGNPVLGSGAAATAVADAGGHVTSLTLTNGGHGYDPACPPYVIVGSSSIPAFFSADVSQAGVVTGFTYIPVSPGYPVGGLLYPPGPISVQIYDGGGGHGEEMNFFHCGISGWEVMFENTTDSGQAYGSRFYGCFGGAGVTGQPFTPTLFLIGNYGGTESDVYGCDYTLQHDSTHPSYLLTTGGEDGFNLFGGRVENMTSLVNFTAGIRSRILIQGLQPTNVTGPWFHGDMGVSSIAIRDCVLSPGTLGPLSGGTAYYNESHVILDDCDLGYSDISSIVGNTHFTLRDSRNSATGDYQFVTLPPQTATFTVAPAVTAP